MPKIEHLTHPKPYVVPKLGALPKPFARFSLICSSRNPISCRKLGVLPKPFACFCLICSSRNPISCRKFGALPKPFDCFSLICSRRNPISCRKLGVLPKPFVCFCLICSSRNPCFSWNLERLCISVKPRLAFVISETCKPFSSLSAFSPFSATKAVLRV